MTLFQLIEGGRGEALRIRAILRSLVPIQDLEGVISSSFCVPSLSKGKENDPSSKMLLLILLFVKPARRMEERILLFFSRHRKELLKFAAAAQGRWRSRAPLLLDKSFFTFHWCLQTAGVLLNPTFPQSFVRITRLRWFCSWIGFTAWRT